MIGIAAAVWRASGSAVDRGGTQLAWLGSKRALLRYSQAAPVAVDSARLPCSDAEYDSAICIEVLEHTKDPETFAAEIARIIRGRALFSVPNMELLPYLHDWRVVPWHLLEGDHKNFFTRASLCAACSASPFAPLKFSPTANIRSARFFRLLPPFL